MSDIQSQIRGNLYWISVKIAFGAFFGLLITTIIVRNLSVAEFGIYNLLFALLGYVNLACSFGVNTTLQRYVPELYQKKDYFNLDRIVIRGVAIEFHHRNRRHSSDYCLCRPRRPVAERGRLGSGTITSSPLTTS